eukprot:scaffold14068_cov119-Isochrysis_galbana.AAC.11
MTSARQAVSAVRKMEPTLYAERTLSSTRVTATRCESAGPPPVAAAPPWEAPSPWWLASVLRNQSAEATLSAFSR